MSRNLKSSLLATCGWRTAFLRTVMLFLGLVSVVMADDPSVLFVFSGSSDSTGYWPHDDMRIRAQWGEPPSTGDSIQCSLRNHDNLDAVDVYLLAADSLTFEAVVPYGSGWTLSPDPLPDEVLDCSYGNRITAMVDGVPDSTRILLEQAALNIVPDSVGVGDLFSITVMDRDQNANLSEPESIQVMLRSVFGQGESLVTLDETGSDTGIFTYVDSLTVALLEDPEGFPVLDADTLCLSMWDSLALCEGWEPTQGESVNVSQPVETRSATIRILHPLYGELSHLPLDDSPLTIAVEEPDLSGLGQIEASAAIRSPSGETVDSLTVLLEETEQGVFSGNIVVAGPDPDLSAVTGDSLVGRYNDRANAAGVASIARAVSFLGAELVSGMITDSQWTNENVYLLVDSAFVSAGTQLAVAPGCLITVLPDNAIAWVINGVVTLGEESGEFVTIRSASPASEPGVWQGVIVEGGSLVAHNATVRGAVVGISGTNDGSVELHACLIRENGADQQVISELLAERGDPYAIRAHARSGDRALPGGISIGNAQLILEACTIEENAGYGISILDGNGEILLRTSSLNRNALDAVLVLSPRELCELVQDTMVCSGAGGVYAADTHVSLDSCLIADNCLQGVYLAGATSELTDCTVTENMGGGVTLRDQNTSDITRSLVTRNHLFGLNVAWDCTLSMSSSVIGGNGGLGVSIDYASYFLITDTSLAHNRSRAVHVGAWCTVDTLHAENCWWGKAPPAADSTGVNLQEIWDGIDDPGRAVVGFTPWLEATPGLPAPSALVPLGGEYIRFSSTELVVGDTLFVDLIPNQSHLPAHYAPLSVASSTDTIQCFTLYDPCIESGLYRGRLVLTEDASELTPDQLGFNAGDLQAWWLADSTVLGSVQGPAVVPQMIELHVCPNPFHTVTVFSWHAPGSARIEVYDLAGRRVWRSAILPQHGDLAFDEEMQVSSLSPGVYVTVLRSARSTISSRLVKVR